MGTIKFELRKDKADKQGKAPVRIIYQVQGQRKYISTDFRLYPENWHDQRAGNWNEGKTKEHYPAKAKLMKLEADIINKKLAAIKSDVETIEAQFEANKITYSAEMVLKQYNHNKNPVTKKSKSSKELFAFIDKYISDHKFTRVKGSLSVYKSLKFHLERYEAKECKKITFDDIDYSFFQGFQNFLVGLTKETDGQTIPALNNITIAKQLSTLKTFLNYAKAQGIEVSNKYESFKVKREHDLEVIALTRKEFQTLYDLDLSKKPAWDQVRDVFCFSCASSLRYSDLKQLKREHIKEDSIQLTAIKTTHRTTIPLNPFSKAILKKYAGEPRPLPVISNQKSNEHLAKICEFAGINEMIEIVRRHGAKRIATKYPKHELVRMHCGRKTFASLSIEAGMSAEYVMRIGGWKDYKSFSRYMNLTDGAIQGAMAAAWGGKVNKLKAV
ncbi:MAG: site-specific integrase [Chitinophagaceae bacterium]|nr:site-specific integrase [Chitinophagaceae bacterium]